MRDPSHPLQAGIVRIWGEPNRIVGAGFLAADRHVLTCAHVVADALGGEAAGVYADGADPPTGEVHVDFPLLAPGQRLGARVVVWVPVRVDPLADPSSVEDVAVLILASDSPPNSRPVRLEFDDYHWEHPFRAFGFPQHDDNGVWARGEVLGYQANGWIQIEGTKQTGYFVEPGFSGGPVWDEQEEGVVGMVVGADQRTSVRAARAIPTSLLLRAWPALDRLSRPPCPYRGLLTFGEADAPVFFGRECYTDELAAAIADRHLVAVLGPSGAGKSSVVFAGLVPRLRRDGRWQVVGFTPGADPFKHPDPAPANDPGADPFNALTAALIPLLEPAMTETDRLREIRKLAADLRSGNIPLRAVLDRIGHKTPATPRTLLIADQFEELFTLCRDSDARTRFLDLLLAAFPDARPAPGGPTAIAVLTLRADFLGHALAHRPMTDALQRADLKLGPMTRDELRSVIEGPLRAPLGDPPRPSGVALEDGLADRILDDLRDEPGNLPLLEFALTQLWECQQQGRLTHERYAAIDGVKGALTGHAEDAFRRLSASDQQQAERLFVQLVRPGDGIPDTRRRASRSDLSDDAWNLAVQLATEKLVVTGRDDATGVETVELAHEALIREWPTLRDWMKQTRVFRARQERLRTARLQWAEHDEDTDALLRGKSLADAEDLLAQQGVDLGPEERRFIKRSQDLRDHEARERERQALERRRQADDEVALRSQLRAAAGAIGSGLAYGAAYGVAFWREVRQDAWAALLYAAAWFPLGVFFGLAVGIAPLRFRRPPRRRVVATVAAGAVAAGAAYGLARRWTALASDPFEPVQLAAGALTGAALALGLAAPIARWWRLAATIVLGIIGLAATVAVDPPVAPWNLATLLLAGLLLGSLTGAGFLIVDLGADISRFIASIARKGATRWPPVRRAGRAPATQRPVPPGR